MAGPHLKSIDPATGPEDADPCRHPGNEAHLRHTGDVPRRRRDGGDSGQAWRRPLQDPHRDRRHGDGGRLRRPGTTQRQLPELHVRLVATHCGRTRRDSGTASREKQPRGTRSSRDRPRSASQEPPSGAGGSATSALDRPEQQQTIDDRRGSNRAPPCPAEVYGTSTSTRVNDRRRHEPADPTPPNSHDRSPHHRPLPTGPPRPVTAVALPHAHPARPVPPNATTARESSWDACPSC